jgi:hypothetical protein
MEDAAVLEHPRFLMDPTPLMRKVGNLHQTPSQSSVLIQNWLLAVRVQVDGVGASKGKGLCPERIVLWTHDFSVPKILFMAS